MDSEKEKNRLSDIVLERVGLTGNLLSAPVSPSPVQVIEIIGKQKNLFSLLSVICIFPIFSIFALFCPFSVIQYTFSTL